MAAHGWILPQAVLTRKTLIKAAINDNKIGLFCSLEEEGLGSSAVQRLLSGRVRGLSWAGLLVLCRPEIKLVVKFMTGFINDDNRFT